ncbi:MAG: Rne/Rng family ribonuclease [Candidatus Nanopelagicales bacterium]
MSDVTPENTPATDAAPAPRRRRAAGRPAGPPAPAAETAAPEATDAGTPEADEAPAGGKAAKTTKKAAKKAPVEKAAKKAPAKKAAAKKTSKKATAAEEPAEAPSHLEHEVEAPSAEPAPAKRARSRKAPAPAFSAVVEETPVPAAEAEPVAGLLMFQAPSAEAAPPRRRTKAAAAPVEPAPVEDVEDEDAEAAEAAEESAEAAADGEEGGSGRRRRRRGGRGRRRRGSDDETAEDGSEEAAPAESEGDSEDGSDDEEEGEGGSSSRRRRRRRRRGGDSDGADNDPPNTVVRVREPRQRSASSEVTSVKGSTRLEAKKQRRREGREAGRRRPSILTEAEFLARREAVDRVMIVRQRDDRTQIAVLEDGVLVEHYVNRSTGGSMIGNVYLGKVQNVLPSMEAAFVDVGRGRNAVLYAGEVNWDAAGLAGQPKRIEAALKSGDPVLVQVSKDPLGHKGARLTAQISLPGRFLVYVPQGSMTGISRKLPDTERSRLKSILRQVVPEDAGVIVRTAAEGASEEELRRDVERLAAQWEDIKAKADKAGGGPALLHGEPDLAIKVVRDIFNEDFGKLVVEGDAAWTDIESYVTGVAPDLADRIQKWVGPGDLFSEYRVDEQLAKALDRKVWLPSGGSLVIDRTEAMTVVDVNTGKFTGQGGNLEETVTRNNLEAAEEIVRQLRLRDVGGIVVIDFIDMVLESNRDLVLRRLIECLGRDRTKHQVAEVTSLGLVQMTRKRIGQGLLEVFSEPCEACQGRGYHVHSEPVVAKAAANGEGGGDAEKPSRGGRRRKGGSDSARAATPEVEPRAIDPQASAAMEKVHAAAAKRAAEAAARGEEPSPADVAVLEADTVAEAEAVLDAEAATDLVEAVALADEAEALEAAAELLVADAVEAEAAEAEVEAEVEAAAEPAAEEAPAAPARRTRGPRKATRKAGPARST